MLILKTVRDFDIAFLFLPSKINCFLNLHAWRCRY